MANFTRICPISSSHAILCAMKQTKTPPRIAKKKQYGQHFLRKQSTVDHMIDAVTITPETTILEIGCGDGFLTQSILQQTTCKALHVVEIDPEWAVYVEEHISDERLHMHITNILDTNFVDFEKLKPLVLLANLPYQITFPLFYRFAQHAHLFIEAVVMIQEEPAQKLVAKRGKSYSPTTLFLQHYFAFKLLEKVEPKAFTPPPKVHSRLVHFIPHKTYVEIPNEDQFWQFVSACFSAPRQIIKNNLKRTAYPIKHLPQEVLTMRAQQLNFGDFLQVWQHLIAIKPG